MPLRSIAFPNAMHAADVLVVEDDPINRLLIEAMLDDACCTHMSACNGDEAVALLGNGLRPRMVVSDIRMPGAADGFAVAARARELDPNVRVLLISGYHEKLSDPRQRSFRVLAKPFD